MYSTMVFLKFVWKNRSSFVKQDKNNNNNKEFFLSSMSFWVKRWSDVGDFLEREPPTDALPRQRFDENKLECYGRVSLSTVSSAHLQRLGNVLTISIVTSLSLIVQSSFFIFGNVITSGTFEPYSFLVKVRKLKDEISLTAVLRRATCGRPRMVPSLRPFLK